MRQISIFFALKFARLKSYHPKRLSWHSCLFYFVSDVIIGFFIFLFFLFFNLQIQIKPVHIRKVNQWPLSFKRGAGFGGIQDQQNGREKSL